jgi:glycine cleavage system regulatory protein
MDTVNSEKLANGKVRGAVVVRVPPEHLDTLVLDLRKDLGKGGELKGLRIGSQDITKQCTDLESRLRAARTMEERLLQIIKAGKGEIKDLLQAEKELGVWRTRIEELEGELRYYANLVALSTLTITLFEREIRAPAAIVETERVQMGIEVEEVDQAQRQVLAAVTEAKGRVTRSELKQHAAGQFSATIDFIVAPEAAGPIRDRLRQLGTVARLDIDRLQQTEGGTGRPQVLRAKRHDTVFLVSLFNVATIAPRETVHLNLACVDTEAAFRTILARVQKATGRIVASNLNRQPGEQTTGTIQFEVKTADADALLKELKEAGEVLRLQLAENPDTQNVTRSKRGFDVQLIALGLVAPRETAVLQVATRDVPAAFRSLQDAVAKAKGRILNAQLNEQDKQNITAQLDFDLRRVDESVVDAALAKAGDLISRSATRAPDAENVLDSKIRLQVALINLARVPPRETVVLGVEVTNVDATAATLADLVGEANGRTVESHVTHERTGHITAKLVYDVPLAGAATLIDTIKSAGTVRVQQATRNPQVPEGPLATARLDVTLSNAELIVPNDDGLWPQIRKGLATSFVALSWSVTVVIVGVCFVLPWALVAYAAYRLVRRLRRGTWGTSPVA